jgi:hypothetical protein
MKGELTTTASDRLWTHLCRPSLSQCDAGQQDLLSQLFAHEVDPHVQAVRPHAQGVGQVVPGWLGSTKVIVHEADRRSGPTSEFSLHPVETASMNADSHKKRFIGSSFR